MKKLGMVLGAAAVATFAGCKDPGYVRRHTGVQNAPMPVAATPEKTVAKPENPKPQPPPAIVVKDAPKPLPPPPPKACTCAPGTKHAMPCNCGAADCRCVVEQPKAPAPVADLPVTTPYIVQRGDYLAKISKKFNVTIAALRKANPQVKNDIVKIGQKIQIPGKVDVGEQKVPVGSFAAPVRKPAQRAANYTGATKEYVVKAGDTLGAIALVHGINTRQLKDLNGISGNPILKLGQKLKVPATKPVAAKVEKKVDDAKKEHQAKPAPAENAPVSDATAADDVRQTVAPATTEIKDAATENPPNASTNATETVEPQVSPAEAETVTHVVEEGEDMTHISLTFGVTAAQVRELNNLGENDQLKPGQVIKLPPQR